MKNSHLIALVLAIQFSIALRPDPPCPKMDF